MAVYTFTEQPEPGPDDRDHEDPILDAQASIALEGWLHDHSAVPGGIKDAVRAHVHLQELQRRTAEAERRERDAEHHEATLATRLDPAGHRVLGFAAGATLAILLVLLDGIPLNWAAQAFDLDSAGTWLVTLILVVASAGAMVGFELTRRDARRRALLAGTVAAGYLALLGLRTGFLITVASESLLVAVLQAAMLTAISAGLVLSGSAVLARTRSLALSRSRAAARRARQDAAAARADRQHAADMLRRHFGGLRMTILPWALGPAAPEGVDRARWAAALERAIRRLFPTS